MEIVVGFILGLFAHDVLKRPLGSVLKWAGKYD